MPFFPLDWRRIVLAIIVILVPLFYFNQTAKQTAAWYTVPFGFVSGVFQSGYGWLDFQIRDTIQLYFNLIDIKISNRKLASELSQYKTQLTQIEELKIENERLRKMLDFKSGSKMQLLPARVIGGPLLNEHFTLSINKGSADGVKKGQAVTTTEGVVGYILRVQQNSSLILLLSDRYAVIDAIVQRSRARGIVEGLGPGRATLRYLERLEDVQVGDVIVTNGLDNIFPKGFPIATVLRVEKKQYEITVDVDLQPIVTPGSIEEVFVIVNTKGVNLLATETKAEDT